MRVRNEALGPPSAEGGQETGVDAALGFMRLLWAIEHGLNSTSKLMASTLGLTGPQRLVVRLVGLFPGISVNQIAHILHFHPSTLTGVLKRLERHGHVERKLDPRDGRKRLFFLTETGRALDVPSAGTVEAAVQRVLHRMSGVQLEAAREVLTVLAEELGAADAP